MSLLTLLGIAKANFSERKVLVCLFCCSALAGAGNVGHSRFAIVDADETVPSGLLLKIADRYGPSSPASVAWAEYREQMNLTGWSYLEAETSARFNEHLRSKAMGLVEGLLTRERLDEYLENVGSYRHFGADLRQFVSLNTAWVKGQIHEHRGEPFWDLVNAAYVHLEGILEGYNAAREIASLPRVDWDTFYALSLYGDLDDLCKILDCQGALRERVANTSNAHCSVLIRLTDKDVYMGHSTWTQFEQMTRIYKMYNFASTAKDEGGGAFSFSSYPGMVVSMDDFYQTSSGLVVTETTNSNANADLWKRVKPESLLYWVRAYVATRLAQSGPEWTVTFARYNSGTYNNQWMVVDTKLLPSDNLNSSRLLKNTLIVSELLPGQVHTEDMTHVLEQHRYWMSYNRPFFKDIFEDSGQQALVDKFGDHFSWERTSRGQIFRRLMPSILDEASYQRAMRFNDFTKDPLGMQGCSHSPSASNAIAERGDLTSPNAGCIDDVKFQDEAQTDVKYTTMTLMRAGALGAVAQSGPSYDTQQPFRWSTSPFANRSHIGQPDLWHFPWVNVSWQHLSVTSSVSPMVVIFI